jgi:hypothetical protein
MTMTLVILGERIPVASFEEASTRFQEVKEHHQDFGHVGASAFPDGKVMQGRKKVAFVSFNGRVWRDEDTLICEATLPKVRRILR